MSEFEYRTVDVLTRHGRPEIDATCNLMGQEGWRPVAVISPSPTYTFYSILFEREKAEPLTTSMEW